MDVGDETTMGRLRYLLLAGQPSGKNPACVLHLLVRITNLDTVVKPRERHEDCGMRKGLTYQAQRQRNLSGRVSGQVRRVSQHLGHMVDKSSPFHKVRC